MQKMDLQLKLLDLLLNKGGCMGSKSKPVEGRRASGNSSGGSAPTESRTSQEMKGLKVPSKGRPSFTPQLFKTFEQDDLGKRKMAQAASVRRSASMDSQLQVDQEERPGRCYQLVKHPAFDLFFTIVVITNSIFLGIELQLQVSEPTKEYEAVQVVQYLYTALFTVELFLRFCADRRLFCGEEWTWAWLDLFIVLFSLWEAAVDLVLCILEKEGQSGPKRGEIHEKSMKIHQRSKGNRGESMGNPHVSGPKSLKTATKVSEKATERVAPGIFSGFSSLKAFRIIRITRLVKAVRLVRILRFVMAFRGPDLEGDPQFFPYFSLIFTYCGRVCDWKRPALSRFKSYVAVDLGGMLITSILHTLKSLFWALMLLVLIIYVPFGGLKHVKSIVFEHRKAPRGRSLAAFKAFKVHGSSISTVLLFHAFS